MNVFLAHIPLVPLLYGVIMAMSIMILFWRFKRGEYGHVFISCVLLAGLFMMHGHQAETRMGAAFAVLIIDLYRAIPDLFRPHPRQVIAQNRNADINW
jgi:hypothetical protein